MWLLRKWTLRDLVTGIYVGAYPYILYFEMCELWVIFICDEGGLRQGRGRGVAPATESLQMPIETFKPGLPTYIAFNTVCIPLSAITLLVIKISVLYIINR